MRRLFSYRITHDNGAAPNPFWGVCTLVICKPAIRREAEVGGWVVGIGSAQAPQGDISDSVVYAMKVTSKMTMQEYDEFTKTELPGKVPDWKNGDVARRLGDSIYDFSVSPPKPRMGVHGEAEWKKDQSGMSALLSEHFYYFGREPVKLPKHLFPIASCLRAHRSNSNDAFIEPFVSWLEGKKLRRNKLYGKPGGVLYDRLSSGTGVDKVRMCSIAGQRRKDGTDYSPLPR
jgi:hypothetical protein